MKRNGWKINAGYTKETTNRCKTGAWWGYTQVTSISSGYSSISATFKGYGNATLSFGNCLDRGVVKVWMNKEELHSATGGYLATNVTFDYAEGDVLKVEGIDEGMILLHALNIICKNSSGIVSRAGPTAHGK